MWISNTATTAMMIPIVDAIAQVSATEPEEELPDSAPLASAENSEPAIEFKVTNNSDNTTKGRPVTLVESGKQTSKYFMSDTQKKAKIERTRNLLMMAVAYSANIGGTGVITGSPPNLVVPQVMENRFGDSTGLTFASWMAFAVPVMAINLVLSWMWLSILGWRESKKFQNPGDAHIDPKQKEVQIMKVMRQKYNALGAMKCHEFSILLCFIIVILLWFFRRPLFMSGNIMTIKCPI